MMRDLNNNVSFFNLILIICGIGVHNMLKTLVRLEQKLVTTNLENRFLRDCLQNGVIPRHLNIYRNPRLLLRNNNQTERLHKVGKKFSNQLLKIEIKDGYRASDSLRKKILSLANEVKQKMTEDMFTTFQNIQVRRLTRIYWEKKNNLTFKLSGLITASRRSKIANIKPISYSCRTQNMDVNNRQLRSHDAGSRMKTETLAYKWGRMTNGVDNVYNITIDPSKFIESNTDNDPLDLKKGWFMNMSTHNIPDNVKGLLQLGKNFCLPSVNNKELILEFIINIENNIRYCGATEKADLRTTASNMLNRLSRTKPNFSNIDKELMTAHKSTKIYCKEHPEVIFMNADKGNVTVAVDKMDYITKMETIFSDGDTYEQLQTDPTKKVTKSLQELLNRWKAKDYINQYTYKNLFKSDGLIPRAYGLPKIHKEGCPYRVIVSSLDSPLYKFSSFLHNIIYKNIPRGKSYISNSFQLVKELSGVQLEDHFHLASLDVVSLFTNVPTELALLSIRKRWINIKKGSKIPLKEFIIAVRFVLNSTYFTFNNKIYKQTFGSPMGSPLSPVIADIVLQDLEEKAIARIPIKLPIYYRYVDDILIAVPTEFMKVVLETFNSFHPRLQFTHEISKDNKINFLDTSLETINGVLHFDWYHKPTFSGRYLNYHSHHPLCQKIGTIISLTDRFFLLSHPKHHGKNLSLVVQILLRNGYPLELIFRIINRRIKRLIAQDRQNNDSTQSKEDKKYFVIPFINEYSYRFKKLLGDSENVLAFVGRNKLGSLIKTHKDELPTDKQCDVVYRISCENCDASYVGQTGRQLGTRISEHKRININNVSTNNVITEHRIAHNHDFAWDSVKILTKEPFYYKRLVAEMVHIKLQNNGLNLQNDTEMLGDLYSVLLENMR